MQKVTLVQLFPVVIHPTVIEMVITNPCNVTLPVLSVGALITRDKKYQVPGENGENNVQHQVILNNF